MQKSWSRRHFGRAALVGSAALGAPPLLVPAWAQAPAAVASPRLVPMVPCGVRSGDVTADRAVIWSRSDRPARMMVRWSTTESFKTSESAPLINAVESSDYTAQLDLTGLPAGQRIFYEVRFQDLGDLATMSEPVIGSFRTAPSTQGNVRFLWSGDMVGQSWGINPDFGGVRIYRAMAEVEPDFFLHSGDTIYADGPLSETVTNRDGTPFVGPDGKGWKNIVTEAKSKVAETLDDFRGNHAYNMLDEHVRAFQAQVSSFAQWDDHEVINNWYWEKRLADNPKYQEKSVAVLAARGMRAFLEYNPVRRTGFNPDRIYRSFAWGSLLEIFRVDMRSYRGSNNAGMGTDLIPENRILGAEQTRWLKQVLLASTATWKVIQADMPLSLVVYDDATKKVGVEAVAQGDAGSPKGRELEIADLLRFIRDSNIKNVVWVTADVHYTAAHRYDPNRAVFQEFLPFWEFVSGPLNAGTFGPNELDPTFGPEVVFMKVPAAGEANLPPSAGLQFFGQVDIDGTSEVMTVRLKDQAGDTLFTQELLPET